MNNQEILEKAINKAIAGGWKDANKVKDLKHSQPLFYQYMIKSTFFIFNQQFAKALWGDAKAPVETEIDDNNSELGLYHASGGGYEGYGDYVEIEFTGEPWQYHLQQMVVAEDPIKYLGENI